MTIGFPISTKRVLVVEDEYLVAMDMSSYLEAAGAEVVGPASNVNAALEVLERTELDAAILDIDLRGELAYPVADALTARGIPFVFTTGCDPGNMPARFANVRRCTKPATPESVSRALFGVPALRMRLYRHRPPCADTSDVKTIARLASHLR